MVVREHKENNISIFAEDVIYVSTEIGVSIIVIVFIIFIINIMRRAKRAELINGNEEGEHSI